MTGAALVGFSMGGGEVARYMSRFGGKSVAKAVLISSVTRCRRSSATARMTKAVPIDAAGRAAAKGISGSTLIEYKDAPHGLQATHKERLTQDSLAFIRS